MSATFLTKCFPSSQHESLVLHEQPFLQNPTVVYTPVCWKVVRLLI